ncbi:MAG: ATPase, T2SS/T4P/T4SS family [Candidatus Nanoarchaeia archaeon]|nr:ATPase, T2SS/T4P/T4SS family [Candidatus Haiyanarchaeum thermophilum]MCW1303340.1 ATPase, T2SS/T4P/T4SS family [Candidatus Haiyanarchaeum thermophilum]MCW1304078.1 ATPase, T2SS/T4P/T4SS family [Candidatus Haiyanarchaeum thermophilum]MCW1306500.1 ATPase, T2SS/T4P/T4SS family [Candidatus Haiyanarchaeum thermophilum]MCW1307548.1 ATPase, T2SS/T4P/T4SS family [Candidatus Haiyanarchaeum thermophilum]
MAEKVIEEYSFDSDGIPVKVKIVQKPAEFTPLYLLELPKLDEEKRKILDDVKERLITKVPVRGYEVFDRSTMENLKRNFYYMAINLITERATNISLSTIKAMAGFLIHEMLGLGDVEILLQDDALEEIVINCSREPIWVYHRKHGWLKTNLIIPAEPQIENYASLIGRRVGRQITILNPLMDAYLLTGDRVNATLFPISTKGNTITIRKFRRKPWSITDLIGNKTITPEVAALLWLAIQYEASIIVAGGTASGKTTMLNTIACFIPPNQRVISIEETRELNLPSFLHWVPLTTREPNPEGKGEVTMLDLIVNSLRMRPDRIIVGEIRRKKEAEVLFEALHTGHPVYSTLHAETSEQAITRMISPPIEIPPQMLASVDSFLIMFRDRRTGIRRVYELSEIIPTTLPTGVESVRANILYKWNPKTDEIVKERESAKLIDTLQLRTGLGREEIREDLMEKASVLNAMVKEHITEIDEIGKIIYTYYTEKPRLMELLQRGRLRDVL